MLLRGINGNRHLADASNIQQNSNNDFLQPLVFSRIVEEQIETSLEHFAHEDATVLAEAYHNRAGNERSLLFFAHCLTRASSFESAYHLLKTVGNPTLGANGLKTAKSRYLFAYCAFALNRLQEAENTLRDTHITDQVQLHPSFKDTPSLPYAHSLLARILSETNRVESAQHHWTQSIQHDPMLWTSLRSYCDVGGQQIREVLQSSLDELAQWQSNNNEKSKKEAGAKVISKGKEDEDGRRARTPSKNRSSRRNVAETTAPLHPSRTQANTEKRRTRLRNNGADARYNPTSPVLPNRITSSMALRASENSPLTRSSKLGANNGPMLIEQQMQMMQQEDKEEQSLMEMSNKRTTRRATALAAAAKAEAANKDNYIESTMQKSISQEMYQDRQIYYGLMEWILELAEVQEKLSQFKCANALELLNTLSPQLSQLPLSLELRARVFFENGEYKRSCEIFEEIRRLYPRRLQGMEIYSTALWQLNDSKKLSALASEMAEIGRNQPETWCIAGNCFSLEKQHETSIECLERAIRLDHRFGYAYSLLGHELIDMNDLGRAEQAFRKAVVYAPNDYRAWYGLGLVNFKEEKLNLARVNIQRSVQINPTNTVLLCQLAVIEQALHHNEMAMQCLERALKHQPNNVPCRFHRARLLFDTGHYERAKMELEELKVLSPDEAHVFFLLGRVNRKLGDTHMALLNFSWATEIDPRGEQNQSALTTDNGPYDDEPID